MGVKEMGVGTVRIEIQSALELIFRCVPIPIVPKDSEAEFGMSLGESVVNFNGLFRRSFRLGEKIVCGHFGYQRKRAIGIGESGVGERVRRVKVNRLLEIRNASLNFRRCVFGKMVTALEIELIGFDVIRIASDKLLL